MHLHAFYCSFCIIIVGLVLVYALTLYCTSHLSSCGRFTVVERLHHAPLIWICLGKQKVVLNCSDVFISIWNSRSVVRYVLHEARMGFIHVIGWCYWFVWIVKSRSSGVWPIASKVYCIIQILCVIHTYVVLETLLKTIIHSSNWASSIWKFVSVVFTSPLSFMERISVAISSGLSSSAYCSVISCASWTFILLIYIEAHACHVHHVRIVSSMILSISWIIIHGYVIVIELHWVTSTSSLSLFSNFSLSNCFINIWSINVTILLISHNSRAVLSRIEKLCSHHHLLISIWCFPLILKIKINIRSTWISERSPNSTVISKLTISIRLHDLTHIILLSVITSVILVLTGIASFILTHLVSVDHGGISHLNVLILLRKFTSVAWCIESTDFSLIENIRFSLYVWKHVVNSRIVRRLKHNTIVSSVHFIDAKRTILTVCSATLFSNSVSHKESLICSRPK